jgi:hypothetical protein
MNELQSGKVHLQCRMKENSHISLTAAVRRAIKTESGGDAIPEEQRTVELFI